MEKIIIYGNKTLIRYAYLYHAGLPHTKGTQGIQGNSRNFQVKENLRETQGILIFFYTQGNSRKF